MIEEHMQEMFDSMKSLWIAPAHRRSQGQPHNDKKLLASERLTALAFAQRTITYYRPNKSLNGSDTAWLVAMAQSLLTTLAEHGNNDAIPDDVHKAIITLLVSSYGLGKQRGKRKIDPLTGIVIPYKGRVKQTELQSHKSA